MAGKPDFEFMFDIDAYRKYCTEQSNDEDLAQHRLEFIKQCVRRAVREELNDRQRAYVFKYYIEQKTMDQIAQELGVNRSTVSREVSRSRRRLYRVLKYCDPFMATMPFVHQNRVGRPKKNKTKNQEV